MQAVINAKKMSLTAAVFAVIGFAFVQALAAQVKIPLFFTPVPVTMQTLLVLLGIVFLEKKAVICQALYITAGALGAPFFTCGAGPAFLLGPTGGYLFGFFAASLAVPYVLSKNRTNKKNFVFVFICLFFALSVIYFFCMVWLKFMLGLSLKTAFFLGVLPFLPGAAFKLAFASFAGYFYLNRK